MALAGGLSAQFGMADETTFGVAQTVNRFLEFNSDTMDHTIERIASTGLRPNRRVLRKQQWVAARESVAGDVEFDVNTNGFGLLFKHFLGSMVKSQPNAGSFPNVYEYKATVGQLDGKSFTSQIAMGDTGGTVRAFTWAGCKIVKAELMADENGFLKFKPTIDGVSESSEIALAAAAYAATAVPLSYVGGTIKIAGEEVPTMKFNLVGDTKQKVDRYFMRGTSSQQKREQLENQLRSYTGKLDTEFMSLAQYNRFIKGEMVEVTAFFEGPTIEGTFKSAVEITMPAVRFDGKTPQVKGEQIVDLEAPYVALDDGGGTGGVQIVYRTTDTAE